MVIQMRVKEFRFKNYRNLSNGSFSACDDVNVICGNNAQGKTNLLEGIWLFTGERSFRGAKESELITFGCENSSLSLDFYAFGRDQNIEMRLGNDKKTTLNNVPIDNHSKLSGKFCAVIFSPAHLSLITAGPRERRKFLDTSLCQLKPKYAAALNNYNKAITQRSSILRDLQYHSELTEMLDVFEEQAALSGSILISLRKKYIELLAPVSCEYYSGISNNKESLLISYLSTAGQESEQKEVLLAALKASRVTDIQTGNTSVGPHRDDILIDIQQKSARIFGSQGQQRSAVLSLKLAEAEILKIFTGEQPIALFDDVMSELDAFRKNYILNHIKGWQVFITCCDPTDIRELWGGKTYKMEQGIIT